MDQNFGSVQRNVRFPVMLINRFRRFVLLTVFATRLAESTNYPNESLARSEREADEVKYLIFPQGSNVQLVYCLTMSTYTKPQGMYAIGITAGLAWELPHRNSVPYRKPAEVYHRRSRRELYRKVELMLRTKSSDKFARRRKIDARDGKACVLKAICKAARRRHEDIGKGSFVQEILHAIFTLPGGCYDIDPMTEYERTYYLGENCDEAYAKCPDVF